MTKLKNSNCDKTKKNPIVTKPKNSNFYKTKKFNFNKTITQIVTKVIVSEMTVVEVTVVKVTYFSKDMFTPQQPMRCSRCSFS